MAADFEATLGNAALDRRSIRQCKLDLAVRFEPQDAPDALRKDGVDRSRIDEEAHVDSSSAPVRPNQPSMHVADTHAATLDESV
jgi:hypothetical protein